MSLALPHPEQDLKTLVRSVVGELVETEHAAEDFSYLLRDLRRALEKLVMSGVISQLAD